MYGSQSARDAVFSRRRSKAVALWDSACGLPEVPAEPNIFKEISKIIEPFYLGFSELIALN